METRLMLESMKNREVHPIGTRVMIAQDRLSEVVGTVTGHTEDSRIWVHWDGDIIDGDPPIPRIIGPFMACELRKA